MISRRFISVALNSAICASAAALVGCNQQPASPQANAPTAAATKPIAAASVAQAPAYTPPTADQLYQLVAPIALFPDKLVAQVLAGSTYPDQVSAADSFLEQNQSLQGSALQDAVNPQSWDPSIKGLTVFPKVLDQMAQNIPWTTALGTAYANDPTDVLNAIQVMRQRASKHGSLRSSAQLRVVDQPVSAPVDDTYAAPPPDDGDQPAYYGGGVVPAPQQTIEILPADQDTVYVPEYDPQTVYGEEVETYPSYRYEQSGYSTGQMVTTGALAFGAGIVVASLFEHSNRQDRPNYGWNSWGMRWHGNDRGPDRDGGGRDAGGRWQRPAVVHNNTVYVSKSTTVNNRTVNNIHVNGNHDDVGARGRPPQAAGANRPGMPMPNAPGNRPAGSPHAPVPSQPMSRPNFNGALTKGQPARFAHPGTQPVVHPGAASTPAGHPPEAAHEARINMPGTVPPTAANRMHAPRPDDAAQPHNIPGRMGSMRTPGQRINPAAPPQPVAPVSTRAANPVPADRPRSHLAPLVPRLQTPTRPQLPAMQRGATRPAPIQHAPMPIPAHHDVPHPAPMQHAPTPMPVRHDIPHAAPRPPERAQQHAAPRPQPQAHDHPPPQKGGHPPKKDDKNH